MSDKKEIKEPELGTEEAKERELDEHPKPTRKESHPATPSFNKEPSTHDKIKVLNNKPLNRFNEAKPKYWRRMGAAIS